MTLATASCTPVAQKSLLTNLSVCENASSCTQTIANEITGQPSITASDSVVTMGVDKSDLVEITGTCQDLGRKNNQIVVEVLSDEDESIGTNIYIKNDTSDMCLTNVVGLLTSQQCFFVTHGNGLSKIDTGTTHTYPQCINGRFGFKVRLGGVSTVGAVVKNYLVRMDLRTENPGSSTGWVKTTIQRNVSAPNFSVIANSSLNRCEVKIEASKFKHAPYNPENIPSLSYMVMAETNGYTATGTPNPAVPVSLNRFTSFAPVNFTGIDGGDSVYNFFDGEPAYATLPVSPITLMPGTKYNYRVKAYDGFIEGPLSSLKTCEIDAPSFSAGTSGATCNLAVTTGAIAGYSYEWAYSTNENWYKTTPYGASTTVCFGTSCVFDMSALGIGIKNYITVRAFNGGFYGKWARAVACARQP